ncbi:uncharacterized protein LOC134227336 [Armigeres subalbatus]|uniref:uncharacterized protein LOC134227336 n=1 Tax=Armigeres subalbatus TaxID=124917 RepID=UPI002ED0B41C
MAQNTDNLKLQDFQNCCRLCFEQDSLLENVLAQASEHNLVGKINDCVDVSILLEDAPATSICQRCLTLVEQFYEFKQLCKKYDYTFQTSIRLKNSETDISLASVTIKSEVFDEEEENEKVEQAPLEISSELIKQESECEMESESELEDGQESADGDNGPPVKRGKRGQYRKTETKLLVRLIHNGFLMNCKAIKLSGVMQWICRNSACRMSFTATVDWNITLHTAKVHNHYPFVESTGMIYNEDSEISERFSVSSFTGKKVLVWNHYEWVIGEKRKNQRKAVCKENKGKCRKYVIIKGDFESLKEFGEHNHPASYILYRDDDKPDECELNPWDLFVQINPCGLPIGTDWDSNRRVKLFHNKYQYRLMDCTWNGTSRWACDTVNCPVFAIMDSDEKVSSVEHNHEPLASGIFNKLFYSVVRANTKCLKLCFNGHCYGSRDSNHWVCTTTNCYAKLFVGNDFQSFAEKGQHKHDGFSVVVKPITKKAVFLTPQNPFLPTSMTIEDLHTQHPSTSQTIESKPNTKLVFNPEQPPQIAPRPRKFRETVNGSIRMVYDGYRYSLWDFFPDGTTYWCCWGMRCKKAFHMSPQGLIYCKNENQEHQHPSPVSKVDHITLANGDKELYAIYKDNLHNTILVYRNTLWDLVLGEQCYVATCQRCGSKLKITENFNRFEQSPKCTNHDNGMVLIRVAAKPLPGDSIIWELFKQNYPLRLTDGTLYNKGRHSQMFNDGFRYTLVSLTWNGGELWRCAIQRCPARCRVTEPRGNFVTPTSHTHGRQVLLRDKIWSETRQRAETYFVVITLKKTIATLYYNSYCYALKDKQHNVWSCFPGPCHAMLRIEGNFERVVDEMEHSHDGTLTFIRDDETYASQQCYAPTIGTSKKRQKEESDQEASADIDPLNLLNVTLDTSTKIKLSPKHYDENDSIMDVESSSQPSNAETQLSSTNNDSPKLQAIIDALVQPMPKGDQTPQPEQLLHYYGGYTYNRSIVQSDGSTKLQCNKPRCPGRVIVGCDKVPRVKDAHTHTKSYDCVGNICDLNGQSYPYILVNGSQRRTATYFVCDGFRYHIQIRASNETEVAWQCTKCPVKATVNDSYSCIQFTSAHTHEPFDIIIPDDESTDPNIEGASSTDGPSSSFHLDEVIWGQHRYNKPIFIRRMNIAKWRCYRTKECKALLNQNAEGVFKEIEPHDHEGPIDVCGEARFDPIMKLRDRFALMKTYGKSKLRHMVFQNQIYVERDSCTWICARKSCNAHLNIYDRFDFIQPMGIHTHQPCITMILFPNEVQSRVDPEEVLG